jgi:hypothetical protein
MNEPAKENPKAPRRSKRRPAMEPLGWDEIVSQPGMGGYLSFLNGPVPLPHLQGSASVSVLDPVVVSGTLVNTNPEVLLVPAIEPDPAPAPTIAPASEIAPAPTITPEVDSIAVASAAPRLRIRKCSATHDGHSLGEEVLYQALWKASQPETAGARTIVIGWRGMSQLCRMTPKNCKINTQRLIRKLALEVLSPYNTPESIGTTYRVYSDQAILQRRREAGLEWVVRSRGVEFVNPTTGTSILPICAPTYQSVAR